MWLKEVKCVKCLVDFLVERFWLIVFVMID